MRTKRVNRYYCDFCKKAGQARHTILKHESRCTLNPNRTCGVCEMLADLRTVAQRPMAELLAALPEWDRGVGQWSETQPDVDLPALRAVANNCPACILAALRQKGIPVPAVSGFDFDAEMKAIWNEINEAKEWF